MSDVYYTGPGSAFANYTPALGPDVRVQFQSVADSFGKLPSAELAAVIGAEPVARTEVIKKLWDYIKANGLQDATNKRAINADAKLQAVFGKDQVTMFELAGIAGMIFYHSTHKEEADPTPPKADPEATASARSATTCCRASARSAWSTCAAPRSSPSVT